jgi:hypothetical protein
MKVQDENFRDFISEILIKNDILREYTEIVNLKINSWLESQEEKVK